MTSTTHDRTPDLGAGIRCGLLGPLSVRRAGRALDLGPPKRRVLVLRLLLEDGRTVTTDGLCEDLWSGRPPAHAVASLQSHISRLRTVLEPARPRHGKAVLLVRESSGYALHLPAQARDTIRFDRYVKHAARALAAGRAREAREEIEHGLRLWRGPALQDARDYLFAARHVARLDAALIAAEELRVSACIADADLQQAVSAAEALATKHPFREVACALLMCSLYLTGRHTEALEAFQDLRRRLTDELGLQPSPVLTGLQEAVLRHDVTHVRNLSRSLVVAGYQDTAPASWTRHTPPPVVPAPPSDADADARGGRAGAASYPAPAAHPGLPLSQLPPTSPYFVGRETELAALHAALPDLPAQGLAPSTVVIDGMPGVGKTALALRFAHQAKARFPDGQLFVDLRGFHPSEPPASPADVLEALLTSLGLPPTVALPPGTAARAALLRSLLSRRRALLFLDNARDESQVRPLLPGAPGCMIVITSRHQLPGLVTHDGARVLPLDTPTRHDSEQALRRRLGAPRVLAEAEAADDIVRSTGRLPLALAVTAARAALHPELPLRALAHWLRSGATTLDALTSPDSAADVRTAFAVSYRALGSDARRLFRLLALHPGPDISPAATASLAALPATHAQLLLNELTRTRMLTEHPTGRYRLHPLLRAYATELVTATDPDDTRQAARRRMYDHYLHTATRAIAASHGVAPVDSPGPAVGVCPEEPATARRITQWFTAEEHVLAALRRHTEDTGFPSHSHRLGRLLDHLASPRRAG